MRHVCSHPPSCVFTKVIVLCPLSFVLCPLSFVLCPLPCLSRRVVHLCNSLRLRQSCSWCQSFERCTNCLLWFIPVAVFGRLHCVGHSSLPQPPAYPRRACDPSFTPFPLFTSPVCLKVMARAAHSEDFTIRCLHALVVLTCLGVCILGYYEYLRNAAFLSGVLQSTYSLTLEGQRALLHQVGMGGLDLFPTFPLPSLLTVCALNFPPPPPPTPPPHPTPS
jgi:hypothetical protein